MTSLEAARTKFKKNMVRWGYMWALWAAILWGAWYVPGEAIWYEFPYINMAFNTNTEFLTAAAVITSLNAIAVLFFMFVWNGVLGKWKDYGRTLIQFRKVTKWYFLAGIFGGPMAIFGSFLAIGFIGGIFAAVAALMYPIVGAILANKWYGEKITRRAMIGIAAIIAGGIVVFAPGILSELQGGGSSAWLGYLGGLMAATGWGIEGAIAGRALDVTDPDVGLTLRFTGEVFWWLVVIIPFFMIFVDIPVLPMVAQTITGLPVAWLLLAGITFGFCYVSWYKSFPLIGVGRGQAIGDLYGLFAIIFISIFTLTMPEWNFVLGALIVIIGGFVMYTEKRDDEEIRSVSSDMPNNNDEVEVIRNVEKTP
ncbi:Permease of the drug/metabolite transporter (DMT) superfamily [Alteribacillus bidgolensis]|uniref:Permease of the drug/metabolite transporter (DMT) superfamily n=2 Tax=Alteribacillus bidgolensis TaxID=930129 RepID=A0A1G8REV0_9BACI|nr:Permease of the drug/metabolite transporter (DMT) superfamily [Alteribacillus bidgolensis]